MADVALLSRLVATSQKDDQRSTPLRIIDTVSGAEVDLQLGHAPGQIAMLSWVAMDKPIDAHLDPCGLRES